MIHATSNIYYNKNLEISDKKKFYNIFRFINYNYYDCLFLCLASN
jgi:hypothetical protein